MKKICFEIFLLSCCVIFGISSVKAQAVVCPSLTLPSTTTSCGTPCATLNAVPSTTFNATTSYSVTSVTYSPFPYNTGTQPTYSGVLWSTTTDDYYGDLVSLPFNFCFFGTSYSAIVVGTNGNINFNTTGAASLVNAYDPYSISGPLPGSNCTATENAIMGVWNDTYVGGGRIYYKTVGTAPCRSFVISWNAVDLFLPGTYCDGNTTTSEIVLYEASNIIDIYIGNRQPCTAWNNGYAVCGIENNAGTVYYCPPGENGTTFSATNLGWRFTPTGAASGWTYSWAGPGGTIPGTGPSVVVCPSVTSTYTVTATSGACVGVTISATATVTSSGTSTPITGIGEICEGGTTTLTNTTPGGIWSSSNPAVATVNTSGAVTGVSGGTTVISYAASGCTATFTVTVDPTPTISGTTGLCVGASSTLSSIVAGGTWSSGSPGVATIGATTGILTGITAGTSVITYTSPAGCTATVTANVIVLSPIAGTMNVCQGSTTSLSDGSGGGTWTSSNTAVATIGLVSGNVTGISGGVVTITYSGGSGCLTTAPLTVEPISPITGTANMCAGFTTTLSNALPGGNWSSANLAIATVNAVSGVVQGIMAGTATISYTLPTGCVTTLVVTVDPKPAPPIPDSLTFCQFSTATAVSASGSMLSWYGPGITPPMSVAPVPSTSVAGTIIYFVTQTSPYGCVSDSAIGMVTIKPQPSPPITTDTTYCQFYSGNILPLNFQVDSLVGSLLNWYSSVGAPISSTPIPNTTANNYPTGITWLVSQTVNGCESQKVPVKVVIVPLPQFNVVDQGWVCVHDSIQLSFSLVPGSGLLNPVYSWNLPMGSAMVDGTAASDSIIWARFDSSSDIYYHGYLTIGNLSGECQNTDSFTVKVVKAPASVAYTAPGVCLYDTTNLELTSHSINAYNYFWYVDGNPLLTTGVANIIASSSGSGGPYLISWEIPGTHIVKILCSTVEGCISAPAYDTVEVHSLPDATFEVQTGSNGVLCLEDSVLFTANAQDARSTYLWKPEHFFDHNNRPSTWGRIELSGAVVELSVTDEFGCHSSYSRELDPSACCIVTFPTAFTPNGDGHNDKYRPVFAGYHRFHIFMITNRWGQVVFESTDSNPEWDGNYGGVPQDMGTYFYYIKFDCNGKTIEQKGDCTLIR